MTQYTLGEKAIRQIAEAVARILKTPSGSQKIGQQKYKPVEGVTEVGELTSTLARNGAGTFQTWIPDISGGMDSATSIDEFDIVDVGMIPAAVSPIPSGTVIAAIYCRGRWVLIAYDCDAI